MQISLCACNNGLPVYWHSVSPGRASCQPYLPSFPAFPRVRTGRGPRSVRAVRPVPADPDRADPVVRAARPDPSLRRVLAVRAGRPSQDSRAWPSRRGLRACRPVRADQALPAARSVPADHRASRPDPAHPALPTDRPDRADRGHRADRAAPLVLATAEGTVRPVDMARVVYIHVCC